MGSGRARQFIVPSDCLDVFSRLPENTFDAIITDPPYGTAHKDTKVLKGRKPICMGRERLKHPTQKPLKVFEWLLKIFTNEHDLVLDCFAGTGSLAEAVKKLNRSSFSIESDKTYFQLMVDRLSGEKNDESDTLHIFSFPEDILKFMDFISDS
ncbi:MAG: DNA methyltransferase [bacterium]|jgi:DNA modification methylase|nr:DNA methyltransferase [bacterium]